MVFLARKDATNERFISAGLVEALLSHSGHAGMTGLTLRFTKSLEKVLLK